MGVAPLFPCPIIFIVNEGRHMTLLEADINMVWKASSVNTGVDDYAAMNTFCTSSSGFGCSARITANNFGYNVHVGGATSQLINAIVPLFIFERVTS
jgi:hypothetical protein